MLSGTAKYASLPVDRAVFLWTDAGRTGRALGYAVQKITASGSTHFPDFTNV